MATRQIKYLLLCVYILVGQTTKGVHGQCSTPPINLAVYEGTQNTMMTCNSPTKVSWMVKPASDELGKYNLINYDDVAAPQYTKLFGVNQTGLVIKTAQGSATIPPISTAGLYIINSTNEVGAKLLVVRQPPTCSCTAINSTQNQISCSVTYCDSNYHPIEAKMTWTSNGNFYRNDTPLRKNVFPYSVSTSTITINATDSATYQCKVTFRKPTNIQYRYVATNAPVFSATCTSECGYGRCSTPPINLAVYEGTQNTMMTCNSPTKVFWVFRPTSDEIGKYKLTKSDSIAPQYTKLFSVNQTGMLIKTAQVTAAIPPISTAGLYVINHNTTSQVGAKLLVVRQPPTCSCAAINSTRNQINCSILYGDSSYYPINAKMTWTSNGNFYTSHIPMRTLVFPYCVSTSTITVDASDSATYQCEVTFEKTTDIQFDYVATNAPEFSASCTSECPCKAPLKNIVVYEGDLNTFIYYPTSPNGVKWSTLATTDELTTVDIVNYNDVVDPSQAADYAFCPSGLTIKNATINTAEPGHHLSTAGFYTVECGGKQFSFKILVVRQGPTSLIRKLNATSVEVSCSTIYADSTYDPIAAIFTLYADGNPITSNTPQRTNYDQYTWISKSTFTTAYSDSSTYECGLTFSKPTEIQDPNVAMNAPMFSRKSSVSTPVCGISTTAATECNCAQTTACTSPDQTCTETSECQSDGTRLTDIYDEYVVKAELYAKYDNCCPQKLVCGVVVTLRNDSRWLIHDSSCDDNKWEIVVVNATCMSTDWQLLAERNITTSVVGDYVQAGSSSFTGPSVNDHSNSCKRMMNLPQQHIGEETVT